VTGGSGVKREPKQKAASPGGKQWKERLAELRARRRQMRQVAKAVGLDPDSAKGIIVWEFLLHSYFGRAVEAKRTTSTIVRELLNLLKSSPSKKHRPGSKTGTAEGKSLSQHLEQLYGPGVLVVEDVDDEKSKEKRT
jgi:hypothetical protein